ncbi:hypothetical protein HY250_04835 [Candidatus Azambacteria bacterium]|nr:hypothetical protein [Candidatus Azambacteria bacterium]MBI3685704.1 hypothetical protein [Candidatus Azambacteria bacterium]
MKKYFSYSARHWIALILKLLGISIASVFIVLYLAGKITDVTHEIEQARNEFTAFSKKYEFFDRLRTDYARVSPHVETLESAIPPIDNFPVVANYIASAAARTFNEAVTHYDPVPTLNESSQRELSFSMEATGSLKTVRALLKEFESAPYFIEVKNLSFSFPNGLDGPTKATLAGVIYFKDAAL